jgi:hypothetical protein
MSADSGVKVRCDCNLQHEYLVAISTRRAHRRKYGISDNFGSPPLSNSIRPIDGQISPADEDMLSDDGMDDYNIDYDSDIESNDGTESNESSESLEEDDTWNRYFVEGDPNDNEDYEDSEEEQENPFEDVWVQPSDAGLDGLVFGLDNVEDEIEFLKAVSGYLKNVMLLTLRYRTNARYATKHEVPRFKK